MSYLTQAETDMNPFSLEISVIQLAPTSTSCSSHTTIGDRDIEVVSDVYSKPQLVDLLCQSVAGRMLSINVKNTSIQRAVFDLSIYATDQICPYHSPYISMNGQSYKIIILHEMLTFFSVQMTTD